MENYILTVGGISSLDYGIYVLDSNDEDSTTRDYESVQVDGRSGDLHFDNGRWANVDRTYKCVCMENARQNIPAFVAAIMSSPGYKRLEDTLHYDYYKIGVLKGEVVPKFSRMKDAARFDLTFDCKPQKYLKIGERQITLSGTNTIMNPLILTRRLYLKSQGTVRLGLVAKQSQ
jgi:phage-related protein